MISLRFFYIFRYSGRQRRPHNWPNHNSPNSQLAEITTGRKLAEKLKFQGMDFFQSLGIKLSKLIYLKKINLNKLILFYFNFIILIL